MDGFLIKSLVTTILIANGIVMVIAVMAVGFGYRLLSSLHKTMARRFEESEALATALVASLTSIKAGPTVGPALIHKLKNMKEQADKTKLVEEVEKMGEEEPPRAGITIKQGA